MNNAAIQHILTRLYTDEETREVFLADRDLFCRQNSITDPEERAFFGGLKYEQIDFFAKGLYAKRFHAVHKLLPGTAHLMGDKFKACFAEYSRSSTPAGIHKHHEDAVSFVDFIKTSRPDCSFAVKEISRYEQILLKQFLKPERFKTGFFCYNAASFLKEINHGEVTEPKRGVALMIWKNGQLRRVIAF